MSGKRRKTAQGREQSEPPAGERETVVRIIGGLFRGRRLRYHGDTIVRPMKHRTREAIFNLIGTECKGKYAIDLFAGTGALGLEALSRGAIGASLIEKHVPSARVVADNVETLCVGDRATLVITSAFLWVKRDLAKLQSLMPGVPWLVFCSPPYDFFVDRRSEMLELIECLQTRAVAGSVIVVEADDRFDMASLPDSSAADFRWDVRSYPPAVIGIWRAE